MRFAWLVVAACSSDPRPAPPPTAAPPPRPAPPAAPAEIDYFKRACGGGFGGAAPVPAATRPAPATDATDARAVLARMVDAHGGVDAWKRARALTFTHVLAFGEPLAAEWFISEETTEIATRKTYQTWPLYGGELGFDGTTTWTRNWKIDNPPGVNVNAAYDVLAMPWLALDPDLVVTAQPPVPLPGDVPCHVVRVRRPSQPEHKYFDLYIHRETALLVGVGYHIVHGGFLDLIGLPREQKSLGPFVHVFYRHVRVGGLLFPAQYETFDPTGGNSGRHAVYGYRLADNFDATRTAPPPDATVDTTPMFR
jgi:hypothetical protein